MIWPLRMPISTGFEPRRKKLIVLSGPTACGKTHFSLDFAEGVGGEIISCDSMQVYRGMDIGTAKVTLAQQERVPHHLIDIRDVTDPFSVVDFYYEAQQAIDKIHSNGNLPIVVGGAGFYLRALLYGPPEGPPSVPLVRQQIEAEMAAQGCMALYRRLQELDPIYAESITVNDRNKIVRALEIIKLTGERVSSLVWKQRKPTCAHQLCCFFLYRPREILYERIERRCDEMLEGGFLEEVERLKAAGLCENRSASQAIGYRQALDYLETDRSAAAYAAFVASFKQASRHYVKRQMTWFRHEPLFQWVNLEDYDHELLVEMMIRECR
jgi:tRNA dimethylallyltransferase